VERGGGRGGLRVGGGEGGEVGGGAAREHERLEPLPSADVEVAQPCATHVAGGGGGGGGGPHRGKRGGACPLFRRWGIRPRVCDPGLGRKAREKDRDSKRGAWGRDKVGFFVWPLLVLIIMF
jgi:hypothetical protein